METSSLHTVQVLTDGRQLSFDQNPILEHTLDSILSAVLCPYFRSGSLYIFLFFHVSK